MGESMATTWTRSCLLLNRVAKGASPSANEVNLPGSAETAYVVTTDASSNTDFETIMGFSRYGAVYLSQPSQSYGAAKAF